MFGRVVFEFRKRPKLFFTQGYRLAQGCGVCVCVCVCAFGLSVLVTVLRGHVCEDVIEVVNRSLSHTHTWVLGHPGQTSCPKHASAPPSACLEFLLSIFLVFCVFFLNIYLFILFWLQRAFLAALENFNCGSWGLVP